MNIADDNFLQLCHIFNAHEVRYVLLGGIAVHIHGFSRLTNDVDAYVEDTPDNRARLWLNGQ